MLRTRLFRAVLGMILGLALTVAAATPAAAAPVPSSCRTGWWVEPRSDYPQYLVGWEYIGRGYNYSSGYPRRYFRYEQYGLYTVRGPFPTWVLEGYVTKWC